MNFVKTTALLTLMTLVVLFSATAFGFDLVSALFFAFFCEKTEVGQCSLFFAMLEPNLVEI